MVFHSMLFLWYLGVTNSLPLLGEGCAGHQAPPSHPQLIDSFGTLKKNTNLFSFNKESSKKMVIKNNLLFWNFKKTLIFF